MIRSVVLIGSGNVAESLAQALAACDGVELLQLYARNRARGAALSALTGCPHVSDPAELNTEADLYLISVSDRAVEEVAHTLPIPHSALVAHTAGSVPLDALKPYPHRAIFYPFQGFSAGRKADFRQIPLFLEVADKADRGVLEPFARLLSDLVFEADSTRRKQIHLAGVIANNFVNQLYATATDLLAEADLPYEVLKPLIRETALKALDATHPARVQTGPAKRGDKATQEGHLALLEGNAPMQQIYELLSQEIWETSKKI